MLLYGAYGYLGHLRWRSIRARGFPMCSAVTWLRHATTCAHTVRLLSAHFDFSAIVYRCPIAIYPNRPYGYRIQKLLLFLRKLYFYSQFNIHLPISISIIFNQPSFDRPQFFVKIHTNFHNTLRPRLIWYCIPLFADLLQCVFCRSIEFEFK